MTDTPTADYGDGTWANLRRRKVVQWGIAYAAGAWGLLQGLEYFSEAFHWPEQLRQVAILAFLAGLPIVLVVAWYHGDRGQQRVTATELAILTLLFMLGGGIFWRYDQRSEPTSTTATARAAAPTPATAEERPSIAVLPFENRSRLQDDAFFVDGIHDDILTQLSKVGAMRVIAGTSVEQFRDTKLTTKEIGETLGVATVLEGGVQRAGERVRIRVQLIDTNTDAHLWAESYDRELTVANMFAIQSEVAAAIAGALKATLTADEKARVDAVPTQSLGSWEAYQLGKQRMALRTSAGLADAERFFREAIDLDPNFALAYVGLADALTLQIEYSGAARESTLSNAEKAVAVALRLDPSLAEAWASSGLIAQNREEFDRAESLYQRAIQLNPNYAPARHWYNYTLRLVGRLEESLAQIQRAAEIDPLSAVINQQLGGTLAATGRFEEAQAAIRRAITIDPSRPSPYWLLAQLHAYAQARFTDAVPLAQKAVQLDSGSPQPTGVLAHLYRDLGDDDAFTELVASAAKHWPDNPFVQFDLAVCDLYRLDAGGAVRHAGRAFDGYPRGREALAILRNGDLESGSYSRALARYELAYPELFAPDGPGVQQRNHGVAIDLALVHQKLGDGERADALLVGAAKVIRTIPRLGPGGYGIEDVQIYAVRGDNGKALAALRQAGKAGWRGPFWRYHRDIDPSLASIRNEPEFKAVFADIERDMARQRAELAARPMDASLDLPAVH